MIPPNSPAIQTCNANMQILKHGFQRKYILDRYYKLEDKYSILYVYFA
jgi:hypothetical protein